MSLIGAARVHARTAEPDTAQVLLDLADALEASQRGKAEAKTWAEWALAQLNEARSKEGECTRYDLAEARQWAVWLAAEKDYWKNRYDWAESDRRDWIVWFERSGTRPSRR